MTAGMKRLIKGIERSKKQNKAQNPRCIGTNRGCVESRQKLTRPFQALEKRLFNASTDAETIRLMPIDTPIRGIGKPTLKPAYILVVFLLGLIWINALQQQQQKARFIPPWRHSD
jgi:hypothetical protein